MLKEIYPYRDRHAVWHGGSNAIPLKTELDAMGVTRGGRVQACLVEVDDELFIIIRAPPRSSVSPEQAKAFDRAKRNGII